MTIISTILQRDAIHLNLTLTPAKLETFKCYSRELIAWNQHTNLTGITDPAEIAVKHFLDSLSLFPTLPPSPSKLALIDVGSGAGFPGLPLKLAHPTLQVTLLEATRKKTAFLQHLVETLKLTDVTVLNARAEEAAQQAAHREQYDVAVARAVAPVQILAEYTLPFVKEGGRILIQKGQHPAEEVAAAKNALELLGGEISDVVPMTIPGLSAARHLVIIHKNKATPSLYPRRPGLPAKKPL